MSTSSKIRKSNSSKHQQEVVAFFQSREFTEKELKDIQGLLNNYYADKSQQGVDEYLTTQGWTLEDLEQITKEKTTQPYDEGSAEPDERIFERVRDMWSDREDIKDRKQFRKSLWRREQRK